MNLFKLIMDLITYADAYAISINNHDWPVHVDLDLRDLETSVVL